MFKNKFSTATAVQIPDDFAPAGRERSAGNSIKSKIVPGSISAGERISIRIRKKEKKQMRTGEPSEQLQNNYTTRGNSLIAEDDFRE
jgi:hypothetical protein